MTAVAAIIVVSLGLLYVLKDRKGPATAAEPRVADDETAANQPLSEDAAQDVAGRARIVSGSDLRVEDIEKMTGREWLGLNEADRKAVVYAVSLALFLVDQNIDTEGMTPLTPFLDAFYGNAGNLNTQIYKAGDAYLAHVRGFVLQDSGRGNKTTDSFYYRGDGYVFMESKGSGFYSVNVCDDATAELVKVSVLSGEGPQSTRLRLPPGLYYLEVTSSTSWDLMVVNQRGVEWLKRAINRQKGE